MPAYRTIADVFPQFYHELVEFIEESSHPDLAGQIYSLPIMSICECDDPGCAMFYTAPRPEGAWGPHHGNVVLEPQRGLMALDVVRLEIVAVEIMYRPDLRTILYDAFYN